MTKLITAAIIVIVVYVAYSLFVYWERLRDEKETKQAATKMAMRPEALSGMPQQLENTLQAAQQAGVPTFRRWLDTYGPRIQDPRKAWIELDYCVMLARDHPKEARRSFAGVKQRTKPDSPVYPRIKQLEATLGP
jgi:hypothetical protein